jgi:uncharacterized protein with PIN domain
LFLPTYSPDFPPMQLAWRKVKARLREEGTRTLDRLLTVLDLAMQSVTVEDAQAFYAHCGYGRPTSANKA